jgi:hypothetical protein
MKKLDLTLHLTQEFVSLRLEDTRRTIARAGADLMHEALMDPELAPTRYLRLEERHHGDRFTDMHVIAMVLWVAEQRDEQHELDRWARELELEQRERPNGFERAINRAY